MCRLFRIRMNVSHVASQICFAFAFWAEWAKVVLIVALNFKVSLSSFWRSLFACHFARLSIPFSHVVIDFRQLYDYNNLVYYKCILLNIN